MNPKRSRQVEPTNPPRRWSGRWITWSHLLAAGLTLCSLLAWWLPTVKENALWGRLSFLQFVLAVALSIVAIAAVAVVLAPARMRRAVGFRLTAVVLSLVCSLIVVELTLGLWPRQVPMDNPWFVDQGGVVNGTAELPYVRPPHIRWRGLSHGDIAVENGDVDPYVREASFETDHEGFRNSRDVTQADLVVVGDSFTEAGNVHENETFTALAAKQLGLSFRNLGRAGYTVGSELVVLKDYALACRPKIIVWQIAESNDLWEMQAYLRWVDAGRPPYFTFDSARWRSWQNRSPSFRLFATLRGPKFDPWPLEGSFRDSQGDQIRVRFLSMPEIEPPVRGHPTWPVFAETIESGVEICRQHSIRFLLVVIPTKSRVLLPYCHDLTRTAAQFRRQPPRESLAVLINELCQEKHIPLVDATAALQAEAAAGHLPYYPFDTHLSPLGHRVVAGLIAEALAPGESNAP